MKILQMTPAQWADVRDNPIQRDTTEHAKKALRRHLRAASPTQALVTAALLPDGTLVKLDGHTRSALWQDGRLEAPEMVQVVVHPVPSIARAMEFYTQFDNPAAAENSGDRLCGAYRVHKIAPTNRLLTHGGITTALLLIDGVRSVYHMVGDWKRELELLDHLDARPGVMPSPLICAALLTLRKHGAKALDFWLLYVAGGGTRIDGKSCGVDELMRIVADLRARKLLASGGQAKCQAQAGRAISCCDSWLRGRNYTVGAKTTDLKSYIDGMKEKPRTAKATP